jgi:uncharacterized membrane protein required for colicin V production
MLGTLLVIMIIAGFALHQYIKGGIVRGFISLAAALIGSAAAFGYYEVAASYFKDYSFIGPKAYPIAFLLMFVFVFALIRELANKVVKTDISFGLKVDRAGGVVFGALVGYFFAGAVCITIGLLPYKTDWFYGRFEDTISNPPQPNGILLNPDGFLSNLFGMLSSGSLAGTNSFALVHADYVDQIFLNRHSVSDGVAPIAADGAVSIIDNALRPAPENLMLATKQQDTAPEPVEPESGKTLMVARLRINVSDLVPEESDWQPKLALAQLRLVLKDKQSVNERSSGSGEVVYPIGYLNPEGQLQKKPLSAVLEEKELKSSDKGIEFAFYVPTNTSPVLLEFRRNIIEEIRQTAVSPPAPEQSTAEQPPEEK